MCIRDRDRHPSPEGASATTSASAKLASTLALPSARGARATPQSPTSGSTTSGAWGHRVNLSLGLGYVKNEGGVTKDWLDSGSWEVELAWKRYKAKVQFQSFYDPKGERIKA